VSALLGALDALVAAQSLFQLDLLALGLGIHMAPGVLLAALAGLLHPLLHVDLRILSLIRRLGRRLWPLEGDGLYERCETVASLWLGASLTLLGLQLTFKIFSLLLLRIQLELFAALAVALSGLLVLTLFLSLFLPLRAGLSRLLEHLLRRNPKLSFLGWPPLSALPLSLFLFGLLLSHPNWASLRLRPFFALFSFTLGLFALGEWGLSLRRGVWFKWIGLIAAGLLFPLSLLLSSWGFQNSKDVQALYGVKGGTGRLLLNLARRPFDEDEDGYARIFGGEDCDDAAPHIHPGADEIRGNGRDEDCDGVDQPLPKPKPKEPHWRRSLRPPYHIILISISALRTQQLGFSGYSRATSPALDRLAASALLFRRAYTPSSRMSAALPSILSGKYPSELLRDDGHFTRYGPENRFLAELLLEQGYQTAAFPGHWYFQRRYGLYQGWQSWNPLQIPPEQMEGAATTGPLLEAALKWLKAQDSKQPQLLWVHLFDPHREYLPHPSGLSFGETPVDRYDAQLRAVDDWLAYFLQKLRALDSWPRTVLVLIGSSGERFPGEGESVLSERMIQVPLIMRLPNVKPQVITQRTSLIDLFPTLLDLAGVPAQAIQRRALKLPGQSLLPLILTTASEAAWEERAIFVERPQTRREPSEEALLLGELKLLHKPSQGLYKLFDLAKDPQEKRDRALDWPEKLRSLRVHMEALQAGLQRRSPTPR